MNFLDILSKKANAKTTIKTIAEADDTVAPDNTDNNVVDGDTGDADDTANNPDDNNDTQGDTPADVTAGFDDDEVKDMQDAGMETNDAGQYFSTNMSDNGMDPDSPESIRANIQINRKFSDMYHKYQKHVNRLRELDLNTDKSILVNKFIVDYSDLLDILSDYTASNSDDAYEIKYQQFLKFKAAFIALNDKLRALNDKVGVFN